MRDHGVERALVRERADVELVDDAVGERGRLEAGVRPLEGGGVEHARGAAQPGRLPARARVGQLVAVDHEGVVLAGGDGQHRLADAEAGVGQLVVGAAGAQRDPLRAWRPDAERGRAVTNRTGAERSLEGQGWIVHGKGVRRGPTARALSWRP